MRENPADLYQDLLTQKKKIDKKRTMDLLIESQYDLIFPPTGTTDSTKFNLTVLFFLLTNCCIKTT